ncbi:unnamed protein product, partial [Didymodactylos carnosus]
LLLGGDFCDKYNVNISYGGKYLTISTRQQQTRVKFQQQPNTQQVFHLNTLNGIAIPPLSSKVIQAASSSSPMSAIFTPSSRMTNKQHVIAPHAILTIDNTNTTTLTLLNTTTSFKRIPQGTTLGQIKNLEDNTCCYVRHNSCSIQPQHTTSVTTPNPISSKSKSYSSIHSTMHELTSHLPRQQQDQILSILIKHKSVFDTSKTSIMNTNNISHRIPILPQHRPIQSYPYRKAAKETQIINEQVKEMLDNHVIRPSTSPWSAPVVIIRKKDGSPRFCVDYRKQNLITERDVYPSPRIDDIIDKLVGSQYFTTLDLKAGYWQIPIEEQDKKKTAFITPDGLFEFNVLPFGFSNAPATFQRIINSVLGVLRWDITLVYLDDIIVYSPSFANHVKHLDLILDALEKANVKLNAAKCSLARKQLGYRIPQDGIKPTRTNVKKTIDFPTPTLTKAAYSFIQVAQFYHRFIKDFSTIAAPLNMFKNKDVKFEWTPCKQSFNTLKQKL